MYIVEFYCFIAALGELLENIYSCRRLFKESWLPLSLHVLKLDQQDKIKLAIAAHRYMSATKENEFSQQGTAQLSAHKIKENQAWEVRLETVLQQQSQCIF